MSNKFRTALLFGAPGVGKGTQGKILGNIPGFFHLSCGEVFRTIDTSTPLGRTFLEYSSRGELVPDDVTIKMWHENLHARTILSNYKPKADLLVLDGIPRSVSQARLLSEHIEVLAVVHLTCKDKEEMIRRLRRRALKENRADDAREDVIRRRWEVYERETFPVLEHYPAHLIHNIDAIGSPAVVLMHVLDILAPVQERHFQNTLVQ